jgi:hypothetical protein
MLRLWVRLNCRATPPGLDDVRREVQAYAAARVPQPEPAMALVGSGGPPDDSSGPEAPHSKVGWGGIIEID